MYAYLAEQVGFPDKNGYKINPLEALQALKKINRADSVLRRLNDLIYYLVITERGFNKTCTYSKALPCLEYFLTSASCVIAEKKKTEFSNNKLNFYKRIALAKKITAQELAKERDEENKEHQHDNDFDQQSREEEEQTGLSPHPPDEPNPPRRYFGDNYSSDTERRSNESTGTQASDLKAVTQNCWRTDKTETGQFRTGKKQHNNRIAAGRYFRNRNDQRGCHKTSGGCYHKSGIDNRDHYDTKRTAAGHYRDNRNNTVVTIPAEPGEDIITKVESKTATVTRDRDNGSATMDGINVPTTKTASNMAVAAAMTTKDPRIGATAKVGNKCVKTFTTGTTTEMVTDIIGLQCKDKRIKTNNN